VIARAASGVLLGAALALRCHAADDPAEYPAAQCAALWLGQDDYARRSKLLKQDPQDVALGEAFRAVAHRLTNRDAAAIDAFISQQVPIMAFMVDAYIYGGDKQSREIYERLMQDCAAFAATQPETRALR
jgi:hypothetical protein